MGRVEDFTKLKTWADKAWKDQASAREAMLDSYHFRDGHQWEDTDLAEMKDKERAAITFNRTAVIISSVVGSEINNRTEVRYIPREIGDAQANEVISAGAEWFRDLSDAEDSDSEAFDDLLVAGLGVTDTGLDFEADPDGEPVVERIDPMEFGYDQHSMKKGLKNSRFFFHVRQMPAEEAEDRFPGFDVADINADWITPHQASEKNENSVGDEYKTEGDNISDDRDTVTVVRIQYRQRYKVTQYIEPMTGQQEEIDTDKWEALPHPVKAATTNRQITRFEWHQAFLGRHSILDQNQPCKHMSTFNVMTGLWDRKEKMWYGLLRAMKDPQRFANKWLSQTLHILNTNAKGGVMIEEGAVEDQEQFEESWAAADGVTWLTNGAIANGRINEKPKAEMPAAFMALTEFAISAIRDASGVNMELLGMRDANQPGVLEYQRRQAAMTTLAKFFDSLRFYRKQQGQTIYHFLKDYIAPRGQLVRLVKEGQEQYVPLAMDDETARYDVVVDDAPQAPNEKEKAWSVIQALLPMLQNANLGMDDWADILEYSPLPASFAEKVRAKAASQKDQGPSPEQQMMLQLETKKAESEIAENMANAGLDQMKTQQIAAETQLAMPRFMADLMAQNTSPEVSPA